MLTVTQIIDISQPINAQSAAFPGDTPFSRQVTVTYEESQVINLTAFTMSPHVGTHADAPVHIQGDMEHNTDMAGSLGLRPYLGHAAVVDVSPWNECIDVAMLEKAWPEGKPFPPRVLFKTLKKLRYDVFEERYAYFTPELISYLAERQVLLVGIDTPSVDPVDSKTLDAHHRLLRHQMAWLENLDLTQATPGEYTLIALPLKFTSLEASPVRAVLLNDKPVAVTSPDQSIFSDRR